YANSRATLHITCARVKPHCSTHATSNQQPKWHTQVSDHRAKALPTQAMLWSSRIVVCTMCIPHLALVPWCSSPP
ncbi:hypothetical protein TorRG33x02_253360, partial [Trema orientale]